MRVEGSQADVPAVLYVVLLHKGCSVIIRKQFNYNFLVMLNIWGDLTFIFRE